MYDLAKSGNGSYNSSSSSSSGTYTDPGDFTGRQIDDAWKSAVDLEALTPEFLIFGPEKGQTFGPFVRGRPHRITRRFMGTLWDDIMRLIPRFEYVDSTTFGTGAELGKAKTLPSSGRVPGGKAECKTPKEASDALEEEEKEKAKPFPTAINVKGYVVRWGKPENPAPVYYTIDAELTDLLFAGVDKEGRLPRRRYQGDLGSLKLQCPNR
ncbi:hypothetical protein KEM54_003385 [Ascosphaera aggregata]|nr:hypothetical protein KEM54_003385 [Ascosphaera aggregata]